MTQLRLVFMGTPPLAATVLEALLAEEAFNVVAVVTQPDQPKGRDLKLQPSAVKELALKKNLPVLQPGRARDEIFITQVRELAPDLIVVAAYGQILPQSLLDIPRFGCLNVHTSLLPKYRGAAPIQWAIINGDAETGVTIMKMDAGLDTGAIVSEERTPILPEDDSQTMHDRLAHLGSALLTQTIPDYVAGKIVPRPQPAEGASYARKIIKEDGRLDWSQPALALWNRVRGLTPWPGTFTSFQNAGALGLIKIWRVEHLEILSGVPGEILSANRDGIVVACGAGALRILELQREGGKRLSAQQFLAGQPLRAGDLFASQKI
ncbi:MAG TPA: methionyl-tRNA formyltransferase [Verrucomicrobiae bacterium]